MSHQAAEVNQSPEAKKSLFDAVGGFFDSAKKGLGSAIDGVANAVPNLPHLQGPLSDEELHKIDRYFRASNFLTIGQIYLRENPLLKEPLKPEHIKPRLLGHWGTSPGLSLLYIHMNRLIKQKNLDAIFLCGPGHGGPAIVAQTYLEGTYTEIYPEITTDVVGLRKLFRQFSQPGGIPSHVSPNVPGSIHEGGELGYVLSHAFGAVMDSPNLIVLAVVGDGEAETGPLEGSWKGISFLNPVFDGAVLPVLHLNGYKISGPTVLGRETDDNIKKHFEGYGYEVMFVEGTEPLKVHQLMAKTMENAVEKIQKIQQSARAAGKCDSRPRWPLIIMRTPKGWTGPAKVDGKRVEDTFRAHQVPLAGVRESPEHLKMLEDWMKSYKIDELFEEDGKLKADLLELAPKGDKRMSAQPYTNGGLNPQPLVIPDISQYAIKVDANKRATELKQSVNQMGQLIRDIYKANPHSFRLFCPDETNSNRLGAVFEVENRSLMEGLIKDDENVNHSGRVMEVLSEHLCNGWHEGYSLTGRYGLLATYEAFAMVFNSMTLQMVKWFEVVSGASGEHNLPWRKPVSSINLLLTSTCWRNDHNGFSHQGPSFIDTMLNKHGSVARCYFPIDANTLLSTAEHCLASHNRINLIVQDKQPQFQYLSLEEAKEHCKRKVSVFKWASNEKEGQKPDVVICSIGDVMTMEALAATAILREKCPDFTVRFVNVVDLMALYIPQTHPHGLTQAEFDEVFTNDVDVVTAYHAYPGSLHQLVHGRSNASRFHVRGYQENGTTTTPFDMVVLNNVSRYHLVMLALAKTKNPPANAAAVKLECEQLLKKHRSYCVQEMQDMEEVRNWTWKY